MAPGLARGAKIDGCDCVVVMAAKASSHRARLSLQAPECHDMIYNCSTRLGAFQESHPNIDVRVSANNRVLNLKQEGIDLALRYARQVDVPADAIRLFGEKILPMASANVAARAFKNPQALLDEVLLELDERALPWLRWSTWLNAIGMPDSKPKAYLHFNQYDQLIHAAVGGHGVVLGRVPLVLPMLQDGCLVALNETGLGESDYAYWLIDESTAPRAEVKIFRDWIIAEVQSGADELAKMWAMLT